MSEQDKYRGFIEGISLESVDEWFVSIKENGPTQVTSSELRELAKNGVIYPGKTMVWTEGLEDWVAAGKIRGLFKGAPPPLKTNPPFRPKKASTDPQSTGIPLDQPPLPPPYSKKSERTSLPTPERMDSNPKKSSSQTNEPTRVVASQSFIGSAILTWLLYYIGFWLVGFIVNLLFLSSARKNFKDTGEQPSGRGCLQLILFIHFWLPLLFFGAIAAYAAYAGLAIGDVINRLLNEYGINF